MTAEDLVRLATNALFALVFVGVVRTAVRERTRASVDALLLFAAFALLTLETQLFAVLGVKAPAPVALAAGLLLLAIPYVLLRLVDDFAGVPAWLRWASLTGFILLAAALPFLSSPPSSFYLGLLGLYFFGGEVYAAVAFAREAQSTTGIVRRRMLAAAFGSFALGILIALAVSGVLPAPVAGTTTMTLALSCAVAYLVAFAPPGLLRRAWREPDLRAFIARVSAISPVASKAAIVAELTSAVRAATAAPDVAVLLADAAGTALRADDGPAPAVAVRAFAEQRPQLGETIAVPMSRGDRRLGVLLITGRRARLFVSEELELAQLVADQAAIVLAGADLYGDLANANAQLSEATRVKSEFLANMSHELRTPLNAILGFSGLLSEQLAGSMTDRQQRFLRNIGEAGEHLLELINEVLDLSKVEAGKIELRREVVSLATVIQPVVAALTTAAQTKGLRTQIEVPDGPGVFVDPTRLRQVLLNLVSNAVKFTSAGTVTLRGRIDGPDVEFTVTDTGIGIPAAAHGRVFGVFERLHEGTHEAAGTGLGLALTRRLVEVMGGTITFQSREGDGTTFTVRLSDVVGHSLTGPRLLVVEDERHDAELVVAVAGSLDLRTEVVRTLAAAREALARSRPLGIVLDMHLPDGRGELLLRELRAQVDPAPVIVVTVEGEPATALGLGADDYLTKPIDRARLSRWLERLNRPSTGPAVRAELVRAHSPG
ncbi:MAG: hypothetical protein QOH08_2419 [Chloroflexota bacterium]|nr:hypothetical protein [Chloroflexota bacterium]